MERSRWRGDTRGQWRNKEVWNIPLLIFHSRSRLGSKKRPPGEEQFGFYSHLFPILFFPLLSYSEPAFYSLKLLHVYFCIQVLLLHYTDLSSCVPVLYDWNNKRSMQSYKQPPIIHVAYSKQSKVLPNLLTFVTLSKQLPCKLAKQLTHQTSLNSEKLWPIQTVTQHITQFEFVFVEMSFSPQTFPDVISI